MALILPLVAVLIGLVFPDTLAAADTNETIRQIDKHFSKVTAEFNRYRSLTLFGETVSGTRPPKEAIDEEIRLYATVKEAGLLKDPPEQVFWLCQNLLIFSPKTGEKLLRELVAMAVTPESTRYCSVSCLAAGKFGERLAVEQLQSNDLTTRRNWSGYLRMNAVLDESAEPIIKVLESIDDRAVKVNLLHALGVLNGNSAEKFVEEQVRTATDDDVQAAALFALVESAGFDGISFLEGVQPIGPKAANEKAGGLKYLKEETSADSKNGFEVGNDQEFVARFGDLRRSPVISWLEKKGLLEDDAVQHPKELVPDDKKELLNLLIDSKGFGLDAVKGALFLSVTAIDVDQLLALRASLWFSPNSYSNSRTKTMAILIRHAGKSAKRRLPGPEKK